jgi:hypothetical protein
MKPMSKIRLEWAELSAEHQALLTAASDAVIRIDRSEHVADWHVIGDALHALQTEAMRFARTNTPKGALYNRCRNVLIGRYPKLGTIKDGNTRADAIWLATNWEQVAAWLNTLPDSLRRTLNHPNSIKRRWKAVHTAGIPVRELTAQTKPTDLHKQADLLCALKSGPRGELTACQSARRLANLVCDNHNSSFVRQLIRALLERVETDEQKYRTKAWR